MLKLIVHCILKRRRDNIIQTVTRVNIVCLFVCLFVCLLVINATFNNISAISWRSVLLLEETGGLGENHRPLASHWQTLSHNVVHLALIKIRTHNTSDDRHWLNSYIDSCESNYHTITETTAPHVNNRTIKC